MTQDPNNPDQNPIQEGSNTESQTPLPQSTENQEALQLANRIAADSYRQNQLLEQRIKEMEAERNKPTPLTPEEQQKQFFAQPIDNMNKMFDERINAALERQIAPLNNFVATFQKRETLNALKSQMRANPAQFKWLSVIEPELDQAALAMQQLDGNSITYLYNALVGQKLSMNPGAFNITPAPAPAPPRTDPPNLPPSNPPAPSRQNLPNGRVMTEDMRRLARINHMTDDEWWAEMDKAGSAVIQPLRTT